MKKFYILALVPVFLLSLLLAGCSGKDNTEATASEKGQSSTPGIIQLQGFNISIPKGYTATGGFDGVSYSNAIITPDKKNPDYEIEIGHGVAYTSSSFEGLMAVKENDYDSKTMRLDFEETKKWKSSCEAFTYIRDKKPFFNDFIEYQPDKGASQEIIMYRQTNNVGGYIEAELRIFRGKLSDYDGVLTKFLSKNIEWPEQ